MHYSARPAWRKQWRQMVADIALPILLALTIIIQDLRNINVRQSMVQRLLGIGNVEFSSAGGGGVEVVFFGG